MFHAKDGWYFNREPGGEVRVSFQTRDLHEVASATFDAGTWASIVAAVCPDGDTADTFREAQRLHLNGAPKIGSDPRTALGPEHMETLGRMADDVRKARDAASSHKAGERA